MKEHWYEKGVFECDMSDLVGRTMKEVKKVGSDEIHMICDEGTFKFYHLQDCCETVEIESIVGDLNDLVGHPILMAEESTSDSTPEGFNHDYEPESQTWTFYKFATIKGYVDIRWFGSSNGYYSEGVDLRFEASTKEKNT